MKQFVLKIIFNIGILCYTAPLSAQKLIVETLSAAPTDISASQQLRNDLNGNPCGLVKVQMAETDVHFEGNIIQPIENKSGEYWVYMTEGSKNLIIKAPNHIPLQVSFPEWGINRIIGKMSFILVVTDEKVQKVSETMQMQEVMIEYEPKDAKLTINMTQFPSSDGMLKALLPIGRYSCSITALGYKTDDRIVDVTELQPTHLKINLTPLSNEENGANAYERARSYLLDNDDKSAEKWAKEAIRLGFAKGGQILRALELRGYYD